MSIKIKRTNTKSPYIINDEVWVDQGNNYDLPILKTVEYKNQLDLSPSIQACIVGGHIIILTTNGELGGSCNIDHQLRSMKIDELLTNSDLVGHLLIVENHNVHHCQLVDNELKLVRRVASDVDSVIIIGIYTSSDLLNALGIGSREVESIYILTYLTDKRLMLVKFSTLDSRIMRGEVSIPEGVKYIEGGTHNNHKTTIVTNDNRLLMLTTKNSPFSATSNNSEFITREVAIIPGLIDIVRRDCYWLAITEDNKLFIVQSIEDGVYMNASSGGQYQPKISPGVNVPRCDAKFEIDTMGLRFKKFINKNQLMTVSGNIYEYEHVLHLGRITFRPIDKYVDKCSK